MDTPPIPPASPDTPSMGTTPLQEESPGTPPHETPSPDAPPPQAPPSQTATHDAPPPVAPAFPSAPSNPAPAVPDTADTPDTPHAKRPIGIWFYAAALLSLGGAMLAFAALLLPTVGLHAKMWLPMLYLLVVVLVGTGFAALGAGLWMRLRVAWTLAVCGFGGGSVYLAALCVRRLATQIASDAPLTQYGIPWRTTIVFVLIASYLFCNKDVRAFFGIGEALPQAERLRLGVGAGLGMLVVLGLHGLLLVTMLLFPEGHPVAAEFRLPIAPAPVEAPDDPANAPID